MYVQENTFYKHQNENKAKKKNKYNIMHIKGEKKKTKTFSRA